MHVCVPSPLFPSLSHRAVDSGLWNGKQRVFPPPPSRPRLSHTSHTAMRAPGDRRRGDSSQTNPAALDSESLPGRCLEGSEGRRGQPGGKTHFPRQAALAARCRCVRVCCQRRDRRFHTILGSNPLLRSKPLKKEEREEFARAFFWIPDHRKPSILCKQTLHGHPAITLLIRAWLQDRLPFQSFGRLCSPGGVRSCLFLHRATSEHSLKSLQKLKKYIYIYIYVHVLWFFFFTNVGHVQSVARGRGPGWASNPKLLGNSSHALSAVDLQLSQVFCFLNQLLHPSN